jgi:hypothetical protein
MTDVQKEESKKTVLAFIFGLLIGGLLVWAFMGGDAQGPGPRDEAKDTDTKEEVTETQNTTEVTPVATDAKPATLPVGEGSVSIADMKAGNSVTLGATTFPVAEGWIGVREYTDGKLGYINGVIRFSEAGGLVPTTIPLVTPTITGREYAVVMFTEGGERDFNPATDKQLDSVFTTFTAE